jgi:hypothetical protein
MERQTGLGRSLEDVLDSLTPVETDPAAPGRVLFEPRDLERQVDQLAAEIEGLRGRVQHLVGLVPDTAAAIGTTNGTHDPAGAVADPEVRPAKHTKRGDKKKAKHEAEKKNEKKNEKKKKKKKKSADG